MRRRSSECVNGGDFVSGFDLKHIARRCEGDGGVGAFDKVIRIDVEKLFTQKMTRIFLQQIPSGDGNLSRLRSASALLRRQETGDRLGIEGRCRRHALVCLPLQFIDTNVGQRGA